MCCRQVEPHAEIPRRVNGTGDETVKSDRSVVVFHHFGLGRTIDSKQLSQTPLVESIQSPHMFADSKVHVSVAYSNIDKQVPDIYRARCHVSRTYRSISVLETS